MRRTFLPAVAATAAPTHIVCLPGAYHEGRDFVSAGFDARVRQRGLHIDLSFVDVEMQHLGDRGPLDVLRDDVLAPARAAGCTSLWLLGISLGGFIALDYAVGNAATIDGLCLLAPYLGNRMLTREIADARSLDAWQPDALGTFAEERRIWRYLQTRCKAGGAPALFLGFGREDRFGVAHRVLADALPSEAVADIPGGHDWPTWTLLWERFLATRFT